MGKKYRVTLIPEERRGLTALLSKGRVDAQRRRRAQVLLKMDEGPEGSAWSDAQMREAFGVSARMLCHVRQRCVMEGLEVALHGKRNGSSGRPRKLDGASEAQLTMLCCSSPPEGRTRWTLRLLADRLVELEVVEEISYEGVRQTLKKMT